MTWGRALRVWWSLAWRSLLCGGLALFAVSFVCMPAARFLHSLDSRLDPRDLMSGVQLLGAAAGLSAVVWVVKRVLNMRFPDFRIALLLLDETTGADAEEPRNE